MITFNNIVSKFEEFCDNDHFIQTFSYGSPSDVDLEKFEQYPLLHLVYTGGDYNSPKAKTYNLEVYILSLPPSKADKVDFQKESISDAEQVAEDILADIQNGGNIFQFGFHYDLVNASVTPLEEERSNALAGCLLDIAISVPYTYDSCNAPITGVEPDGSGIPSFKARGLLRVKELDGSPDVLSVATINVPDGSLTDDGDGEITLTFESDTSEKVHFPVRNDEGATIPAGTPLYSRGEIGGSERIKVGIADASDSAKMPAIGIAETELTTTGSGKDGFSIMVGTYNTNLSGFTGLQENDVLYVDAGGGLTKDKPTGRDLIQNVGIVLKTNGTICQGLKVSCIGRTNDVPNLTEGYGWLGNASGVATPTLFNFYLNRFDDTASTMASTLDAGTATIERIDTARWTGTGVYLSQQSDTPSSGNVIKRKVYYKNEFGSTDAFGTWTLIHEFADDTSYADALTYINDTIIAGQTNGTAPASLVMTWEDTAAFSGLLDDYPGAAAAYSLRLLDTTYTGSAIRVRRASDNAEQDIGFDNNELDTSALATFCSGTNGFVKTWYSQTGSNDATQTSTGSQPKIYDSVTGVITENGKPAVEFNGSSYWMSSSGFGTGAQRSVFNTMKAVSDPASGYSNYWIFLQSPPSTTGNFMQLYSISYDADLTLNFTTAGLDIAASQGLENQSLGSVIKGSSSSNLYKDGTSIGSGSGAQAMEDKLSIGRFSSNYAVQKQQELVIYNSDQSSNRTGIEDNINDFYSIY